MDVMPQKLIFVTILGWVFVILGGLSAALGFFEAMVFRFIASQPEFQSTLQTGLTDHQMPEAARMMFAHFPLVWGIFVAVSLVTVVAAVGLIRRWNWARLLFMALMGLGILWNLVGLVFQIGMYGQIPQPVTVPPNFEQEFHFMLLAARIGSIMFAIIVTSVFTWIIWKLRSPEVRTEFSEGTASPAV
ncbi:MAG: hypothetical protein PVJ40_10390 [Gammaproteobacteria bacterium]